MSNLNKEFCDLAGICWHEYNILSANCIHCGVDKYHLSPNIDYSSSPVDVLRVMSKGDEKQFDAFLRHLTGGITSPERLIFAYYILDKSRPCKLIGLAVEWMKERKK